MLRAIFSSIMNALKSCLRAVGRAATWPLRAFGGGGGMPVPAPEVATEPEADPVADRERAMALGQEMAALVQGYAVASFLGGAPARLPSGLSDELRAWARGLTLEECAAIVNADETAVSAHIQGVFLLPGLTRVAPRPTATWCREPSRNRGRRQDFSVAAAPAP